MSQDSVDTAVNKDICPRFQKLGCEEDNSSMFELIKPDPNFREIYPWKIPNVKWPSENGVRYASTKGPDWHPYPRIVMENGQRIEEHARRWIVWVKGDLPSGSDNRLLHLSLLGNLSSRAQAGYISSSMIVNVFNALLTDEEYEKLCEMSEVEKTQEVVESYVVIA